MANKLETGLFHKNLGRLKKSIMLQLQKSQVYVFLICFPIVTPLRQKYETHILLLKNHFMIPFALTMEIKFLNISYARLFVIVS